MTLEVKKSELLRGKPCWEGRALFLSRKLFSERKYDYFSEWKNIILVPVKIKMSIAKSVIFM